MLLNGHAYVYQSRRFFLKLQRNKSKLHNYLMGAQLPTPPSVSDLCAASSSEVTPCSSALSLPSEAVTATLTHWARVSNANVCYQQLQEAIVILTVGESLFCACCHQFGSGGLFLCQWCKAVTDNGRKSCPWLHLVSSPSG